MSKIRINKEGQILAVSVKAADGLVSGVVEEDGGKRSLIVKHGRHLLDSTPNAERGEILGRLLDVADGGGFTLVFPALSKPPTEA